MSGSHVPHLQRRNGIYHLRVRVPDDLKLRVGMLEVTRSLRTYRPSRARLLAAIYVPQLMEAFRMLRASEFSRDDARAFVLACFNDFQAEAEEGFVPSSSEPDMEILEQEEMAKERIRELDGCVRRRQFGGAIAVSACQAAAATGLIVTSLPRSRQLDVFEGVARALIEQQRLFLTRLADRLVPHAVVDPLFAPEVNCSGARPLLPPEPEAAGVRLGDAVAAYLRSGRKKWTDKTYAGRLRQMAYVEEHFGSDRPIAQISSHDVRSYRDAVRRLRSNHRKGVGQSFAEKQTGNEAHRIQPKTAALIFETAKAFFRWATVDEGYLATNPAENVRVEAPKKGKVKKSRRPFSGEELTQLFSAPLFQGCKSVRRRFESGSTLVRDDYYWIPILGFYTGARLGEIVQLHLDDIHLTGAIPFLSITDDNSGAAGTHDAKHVKSAAGIRKVPLHPDVIALGFEEFVTSRRKGQRPSKRLFHRIAYGADGQASTVFSKWFARFLDKIGLSDPALVFHSFRHNAEDAFRNANQQQYVIDRIIGHADGATSACYGDGIDLETAYSAVGAMRLKVRLPKIWNL